MWSIIYQNRLIYAGYNFNKAVRYFDKLQAKVGDKVTMLTLQPA